MLNTQEGLCISPFPTAAPTVCSAIYTVCSQIAGLDFPSDVDYDAYDSQSAARPAKGLSVKCNVKDVEVIIHSSMVRDTNGELCNCLLYSNGIKAEAARRYQLIQDWERQSWG